MQETNNRQTLNWASRLAWLFIVATIIYLLGAMGVQLSAICFVIFAMVMITISLVKSAVRQAFTNPDELQVEGRQEASQVSTKNATNANRELFAALFGSLFSILVFATAPPNISSMLNMLVLLVTVPVTMALTTIGLTKTKWGTRR